MTIMDDQPPGICPGPGRSLCGRNYCTYDRILYYGSSSIYSTRTIVGRYKP